MGVVQDYCQYNIRGGKVRLLSRNGHSLNERFAQIASELAQIPFSAVLDGEIVMLDAHGNADFEGLWCHPSGRLVYPVFDLLYWANDQIVR
jgi:bifunctional non-homologous end joining protein LigD